MTRAVHTPGFLPSRPRHCVVRILREGHRKERTDKGRPRGSTFQVYSWSAFDSEAGAGLEPATSRVMSPASYHCSTPQHGRRESNSVLWIWNPVGRHGLIRKQADKKSPRGVHLASVLPASIQPRAGDGNRTRRVLVGNEIPHHEGTPAFLRRSIPDRGEATELSWRGESNPNPVHYECTAPPWSYTSMSPPTRQGDRI